MKPVNRKIANLASNPWFAMAAGLASIVGFVAYLYERVDPSFTYVGKAALSIALPVLFFAYYYSIRVRSENVALRDMAKYFYQINEIYKNRLRSSFEAANSSPAQPT